MSQADLANERSNPMTCEKCHSPTEPTMTITFGGHDAMNLCQTCAAEIRKIVDGIWDRVHETGALEAGIALRRWIGR